MNDQVDFLAWKKISREFWVCIRIIFLLTITWDFFLTVIFQSSYREVVLNTLGPIIAPVLISTWLVCIVGIAIVLLTVLDSSGTAHKRFEKTAYVLLAATVFVYLTLTIGAMIGVATWPIVLNYAVNTVWAAMIIYFKYKMLALEN